MRYKPHNYQLTGQEFITRDDEQPGKALFLDMGLGKTVITLSAFVELQEQGRASNCLIVSTKRIVESVWRDEIEKWDHTRHLTLSIISGNQKQREQAVFRFADIYTVSVDNLVWLLNIIKEHGVRYSMIVFDELSLFKNHNSKRFKALRPYLPLFPFRIGLTGTPMSNAVPDIWAQMFLIDRGLRLGSGIGKFREKFLTVGAHKGMVVYKYNPKPGAVKQITNLISDVCLSMKAEDYLSLPEINYVTITVELPKDVKKKYDAFERDLVTQIGGQDISAIGAGALVTKLSQYADGWIYDEEGEAVEVHRAKIDAVKELLESGERLIIAYNYNHTREALFDALSSYRIDDLKRPGVDKAWNAGELDAVISHPRSVGHGLNVQDGGTGVCWFGNNYSLDLFKQLNARLHRQGRTRPVTVFQIVAKGTIDEEILKSLDKKDNLQNILINLLTKNLTSI